MAKRRAKKALAEIARKGAFIDVVRANAPYCGVEARYCYGKGRKKICVRDHVPLRITSRKALIDRGDTPWREFFGKRNKGRMLEMRAYCRRASGTTTLWSVDQWKPFRRHVKR